MLGQAYKDSVKEINKVARRNATLEQKILYGGKLIASRRRKINRRTSSESGSEVSTDSKSELPQG